MEYLYTLGLSVLVWEILKGFLGVDPDKGGIWDGMPTLQDPTLQDSTLQDSLFLQGNSPLLSGDQLQ